MIEKTTISASFFILLDKTNSEISHQNIFAFESIFLSFTIYFILYQLVADFWVN